MGCGIHAILQEKTMKLGGPVWRTILTDALYLSSSSARAFNRISKDFRTDWLPDGYVHEVTTYGSILDDQTGYNLGEYDVGHFTLEEFVNYEIGPNPYRVEVTFDTDGTSHVEIGPAYNENSIEDVVRMLQQAYSVMFADRLADFRLIVGYDS